MPEPGSEADRRIKQESEQAERLKKYYQKENFLDPKNVVATTIVPVAAELTNGNIWQIVDSLTKLDVATDPTTFEVLLVINNRPDEKGAEYFAENQATLKIFELYNRWLLAVAAQPQSLEELAILQFRLQLDELGVLPFRREQLVTCLKKQTRIHAVNASSPDKVITIPEDDYTFMPGAARNIGALIAQERMTAGVIDFKDADCSFPPGYFIHLASLLDKDKAEMISFAVDVGFAFLPEVDCAKMQTPKERFNALRLYIAKIFKVGEQTSITSYFGYREFPDYKDSSTKRVEIDFKTERYDEGPQLAVNTQLFTAMGRYPEGGFRGEDFQAVYEASKKAGDSFFYDDELPRLRSVAGKYDSKGLTDYKDDFRLIKSEQQFAEFFDLTAKLYRTMLQVQPNPLFLAILHQEFETESKRRLVVIQQLEKLVAFLVAGQPLADLELEAMLKENSFLNQFVIDGAETAKSSDPKIVSEWIKKSFPELYGEPPEEPNYQLLLTGIDRASWFTDLNPRDFMHIWRAAYLTKAKEHNWRAAQQAKARGNNHSTN